MKHPDIVLKFLIAGLLLAPLGADAGDQGAETKSAQAFVQDFYTWYGQEEKKDHDTDMSSFAMKVKPQFFSAEIIQGLKEDQAAQAKVPGEIVGLDFDPIVNAQEDCSPYKAGAVTAEAKGYRVEVYDTCSDSKPARPAVIAAVEKRGGAWVFVDFFYPGYGDLFSVLESLKQEREQSGKGK